MKENEGYIQIGGTVAGVVYSNSENGYTVLRLNTDDGVVTAVGCIPDAAAGESLVLTGNWTSHQAYGQQFKAETVERKMPSDKKAIYEYLAFGAVKGIGPATAAAIVSMFGDETIEIIENDPERLSEVRGISRRKALQIGMDYRRRMGLRRLMEFFSGYGIRPELAVRVYRYYGDDSLDAVRENPYILIKESFGADFFEADAIALKLGFEGDCSERIEAAVIFELTHNLGNGHTFLPAGKLISATAQLISVDEESIEDALEVLTETGNIVRETIAGCDACYLSFVHEAETFVAAKLKMLSAIPGGYDRDTDKIIDGIEKTAGIKYDVLQRKAVELAAKNRVLVITGGPGTGKTTSVRAILELFDRMGLKTVLTAPTGRAAKRMAELTGRSASTVHRLLGAGFSPDADSAVFEHDNDDPLDADAIIMDESSMVDIMLMNALLDAIKPGSRLILVGDADQLPPVGPGNVFSDIIRSGVIPTVKLDRIYRQSDESRIIRNAHMINSGELPDVTENRGDFFFMQRQNKEKAADTIVSLCAHRLPENMGIASDSIQVLTPSRKGETGSVELNKKLQAALNPPAENKKEKLYGQFIFREGDRVMQIRNNYDIIWKSADGTSMGTGIFNGDIGFITEIDFARETVSIDFDGRIADYLFDMLYELELAYAMTVHKAQGSEYKAVVLSVSRTAPALLTRAVLYTAITRARELLVAVGEKEVFDYMAANDKRQKRYSGLKTRLG